MAHAVVITEWALSLLPFLHTLITLPSGLLHRSYLIARGCFVYRLSTGHKHALFDVKMHFLFDDSTWLPIHLSLYASLITLGLYSVFHIHTCKRAVACITVKWKCCIQKKPEWQGLLMHMKLRWWTCGCVSKRMNVSCASLALLSTCLPLIMSLFNSNHFIHKCYYLVQVIWFKTQQIHKQTNGQQLLLNGDLYSVWGSTAPSVHSTGSGHQGGFQNHSPVHSFPYTVSTIYREHYSTLFSK